MKSFKHSLLLGAASVLMYNSSLFASDVSVVGPVQLTAQDGQVGTAENKLEVVAEKEPAVTLNVPVVQQPQPQPQIVQQPQPQPQIVQQPEILTPIAPVAAPLTVIDGEVPTTVSAQNRAADAIAKLMDKKLEEAEEHNNSTALNESQVEHVAENDESLSTHHVEQVEALAENEIALSREESSSEVVPAKKAKGSKKEKLTDAEIAQLKEDGAAKTAARKAAKEQAALGEHEEVISPSVELGNASEEEIAAPVSHHVDQAEHVAGENEVPSAHHVDQAEHVAETTVVPQSEKVEPQATFAVVVEGEVDGKQAVLLTQTQQHPFNIENQPEKPTEVIVAPVEAPTAVNGAVADNNGAVADNSERHDANTTQEETREEPVKNQVPLIVEGTKNGPEVYVTRAEEGVVNAEHQEVAAEKHKEAKEVSVTKEPKEVPVTKEEAKEVSVTKEDLKEVPVKKERA